MTKKHIQIDVSGYSGTGKSTIQMIVVNALREKGFEVEMKSLDFNNEMDAICNGQQLVERYLPELANNVKVTVQEQQLRRPSVLSEMYG